MTRQLLILSPHSDDTAFSLGGMLAAGHAFHGWRKRQLTLFVHSIHAPYAPQLRGVAAITAARCHEDEAFCASHGIELQRLDLEETLVRGYPSIASIFTVREPQDDPLFERTCREVAGLVKDVDLVLAPLGIGGHIEHVMVREACRRARPDALYYEDLPYAADCSNHELDRLACAAVPGARSRCFDVGSALGLKSERLLAYRSQVVAADLDKVMRYSRWRRPQAALTWTRPGGSEADGGASAVEVLWGRPRELALIDEVQGGRP